MTVCSDVADYVWLTGDEACALLDELAEDYAPLQAAVSRLRSRLSPERTHLLLEQVDLRRRAAAKFTQADRMFFTRIGPEQATDEWIATYKAARFADQRAGSSPKERAGSSPTPIWADLCCGIGGDLSALQGQGPVIGVDCDPIAAHFAAANTGAPVRLADVADFDLNEVTAWHLDPDRRPTGRRTTSLEWCRPNLATMERLLRQVPHAAIKLAPATKVPAAWAERCELEWISRDRECRQLVAWHGDLAISPGQRRATVLPTACGLATRSIAGAPDQPISIVPQPDRYIFDLDPAVRAARLQSVLASEFDLGAFASGPTYLTGPRPIADAALACFEVADVLPLEPRKLRRLLRERSIGQLEIKKRGVDIDPETLRRQLKLRGDNAATLLITRVAGRPTAILAQRISM